MNSRLLISICVLLGAVWLIGLMLPRQPVSARPTPPKSALLTPSQAQAKVPSEQVCERWDFNLKDGKQLADELEEMSGVAYSQHWQNVVYHIADSGNDPLLLLTTPEGDLLGSKPFADRSSDPEDLAVGPCPWGGSCVFVADTGDNFELRSERQIHIIDEAGLDGPSPRRQTLAVNFPQSEKIDIEALAVHPTNGSILLFTKEKKRSRVFSLNPPWLKETVTAELIETLSMNWITGAAFHPLGKRLILINFKGALELSAAPLAGFKREERAWFPHQRKIKLPSLAQTEAIAYRPGGLSFLFSSERKKWAKSPWGIMSATCLEPREI